jgi:hypothetical protein
VSLILGAVWGYDLPSGMVREQNVVWLTPFLEDIAGMGGLWFALQVQEDQPIWQRRSVMLITPRSKEAKSRRARCRTRSRTAKWL